MTSSMVDLISFDLKKGHTKSNVVVIDAEKSTLFGAGTTDLRTEGLDLRLDSQAKEASPLTVRGTVKLEGRLRKPKVELDLSGAAGQAGAAAALGAIITPLAAILPFVDPGSDDETECSELFRQARQTLEQSPLTGRKKRAHGGK